MADVVNISTPLSASGQFKDANGNNIPGGGYLRCVLLNPATTACSIIVYDNTAGSGKVVAQVFAAANDKSVPSPDYRIPFKTGLYGTLTGAPTNAIVYWE